ncbi:MAG: lysophospholipid acyltransferase family protein [Candidatus Kapabacteria bacterium]|nr:lysophospholipid acyltransferase family protein [Ignavibacteriota bacterium]MCW5884155.1 lysophospholipid acyltransferase family protein [Candidatus Kapabacteria bacterium]
MEKIDIRSILNSKTPGLFHKYPDFAANMIVNFFKRFLKVDEINQFLETTSNIRGFDFIDSTFEMLNFSYNLSTKDKEKIPSEGRLIIVANHPLGGLDGLALLKAIGEVRKDVKVVANDVLQNLENLSELLIPLDIYSLTKQKKQILSIENALAEEQAIILFPAGMVSRLTHSGIQDLKWQNGAIRFSSKLEVPILPVYVGGRNSMLFYLSSLINHNIGMFMLPQELFRKRNNSIDIKIGDVIPGNTFKTNNLKIKVQTKLLYQHTHKIGKNKTGIFNTEKTIIHPIDKKLLKSELNQSQLLGNTFDGMKIFLAEHSSAPNILKEIARLRELTFRKVGEGTGKTFDMDIYDLYYKHIVLWDEDELEIVGSYRLGITKDILDNYGPKGLYNSSQFTLSPRFLDIVQDSLEVGRSFIQQKYWRSNALDYIWQGIGAYLSQNSNIRYLWGAVSISDTYPELAKALIISYYNKWYRGDTSLVIPCMEYQISKKTALESDDILTADDHLKDFRNLKMALKNMGLSVPVLYRRYTDLTEYGGSKFISFCVDVNFNNAIDGLILVDLSQLKDEVKERYYTQRSFVSSSVNEKGELLLL